MDLMNAYPQFPDKELLRKKVVDFVKKRKIYIEEFEAKYGEIPENIKESLPYREDQIMIEKREKHFLDE